MTVTRLADLRTTMHERSLDALLVSFLPHIRYLTGFSGSNALTVVTPRRSFFLTDGRYAEQVRKEVRGPKTVIAGGSLFEAVRSHHILRGKKRIGVEYQYISAAAFARLKRMFPNRKFVPLDDSVEALLTVKDETEIAVLREAIGISQKTLRKVLRSLREGMTELDIAAEISYYHRHYGADADAFEPIVVSGKRGALPHGQPTSKRIRRGEFITIDMGCRLRGYHSDITRTISFGKPSAALRRMYQAVQDSQQRAIEALRPGIEGRRVDQIARQSLRKAGFGRFFNHSLGHGLGLQVHEKPRLSARSNDMLAEGNVVTVEPGVYVPGVGGVRIEDDAVLRSTHAEVLTTMDRNLKII